MGKIHADFNFSMASMMLGKVAGVTPLQIFDAFAQLPGNTVVDGISQVNSTIPGLHIIFRIEATNDILPDGTSITVKYKRDYVFHTNQNVSFDRFDGIDIHYPAQGLQTVTKAVNAPTPATNGQSIAPMATNTPTKGVALPANGQSFTLTKIKCNCGSSKVGSPKHSSWCDMNDDIDFNIP